jgi:hypothetical protein
MTLVRKLALRISDAVVRWASPGCKEWAEGLAREVEFIASDWAALGWALGSMRVLLDSREVPMGSLDEVPAALQKYVERARGPGLWPLILQGALYGLRILDARSWSERVGCLMAVLASILAGTLVLTDRRRLKEPIEDDIYDDLGACALFYKAELERCFSRLTMIQLVVGCFLVGSLFARRGGIGGHPILGGSVALVCLIVVPAFQQARRNNRRRLERLEALLAEQ